MRSRCTSFGFVFLLLTSEKQSVLKKSKDASFRSKRKEIRCKKTS
ncbi:MAG: TraY domain-containing protein [Ruminococcus sp.]|nr:TraY domain-containing protein [Ruminococcus sp.]